MRLIITFNNKNWTLPVPWVPSGPPNDEIWYTSSDGNIVTPALPYIVSNTYVSGKGIIKFSTDVTSIGYGSFFYKDLLASITIPNSVTNIGSEAFRNCSGLISVTIGNSVTSIGSYTFYFCTSLTSISYTGTVSQWNAITKGSSWNLKVPATVVHCTDGDAPI